MGTFLKSFDIPIRLFLTSNGERYRLWPKKIDLRGGLTCIEI
jgi:hypothetical protein